MATNLPTQSSSNGDQDPVEILIARYLEDDLSPADASALRAALEADPKLRERLVDSVLQSCAISRLLSRARNASEATSRSDDPRVETLWGQTVPLEPNNARELAMIAPPVPSRTASPPRSRFPYWRWSAAAAAVILFSAAVIMRVSRLGSPESSAIVAVLQQQIDAQWNGASATPSMVAGGRVLLSSGLVELKFAGGATVVVQGPADLSLDSSTSATLNSGRVTVVVQGGGFVVRTPAVKVTDLGTEFGVSVGSAGETHVEVFDGSVQAERLDQPEVARLINAGEAAQASVTPGDSIKPALLRPLSFVRAQSMGALASAETPTARYRAFEADLLRDPSLLLYYNFELAKDTPVSVQNRAGATAGRYTLEAAVAAAPASAAGRWADDRAAGFSPNGANGLAITAAPFKSGPTTVSAWVLARTRAPWATIAKNWGAVNHGQFHFGLRAADGTLEAQVRQPDGSDAKVAERSDVKFPLGQWVHVAFVADGDTLRLYRNGQEVGSARCKAPTTNPAVAWMTIGYKAADRQLAPSISDGAPGYWDGFIDDVAIFSRALTSSEIATLARQAPQASN